MNDSQSNTIKLDNICLETLTKTILKDVSLELDSGQCCAVIGPNGSGKSSLISIITGYQWPTSGTVHFCGEKYGTISLSGARNDMSLISTSRTPKFDRHINVYDVVCTGLFETIRLPINIDITGMQHAHIAEMLSSHSLTEFKDRHFYSLSTGEQMNVLICRAMVKKPKLLVLDEPTSGLDMRNRMIVLENLGSIQSTANAPAMLIVSHHISELPERVDKVCMLKGGSFIMEGTAEQTLTSENLSMLYDCRIEVIKRGKRYYAMLDEQHN